MKKLLCLLLCAVIAIVSTGCNNVQKPNEDNKGNKEEQVSKEAEKFNTFLEEQFIETVESDFFTLHAYVEDPESFGINIEEMTIQIGEPFTENTYDEQRQELQEYKQDLQAFDYKALTKQQQNIYDALMWELDLNIKLCDKKFDYYEQPFSSMSGIHSQLPTLLSDYQFKDEQDLKYFIELMNSIKPYVDSVIKHGEIQLEKGLTMIDTQSVIDHCNGIISKKDDSGIIKSINANIDALNLTNADDYKQQVKKAFDESFIPAYENIVTFITKVKESGKNNEGGLSNFEYGSEYYTLNVQLASGSDLSFEDIVDEIEDGVEDATKDFTKHAILYSESLEQLMEGAVPKTTYTSYEEMIEDMKASINKDFPVVTHHPYEIIDIHKEVATDGIAAYFYRPAVDATKPRQMRVNPNNPDGIDSYSIFNTVAHEGIPGHMYHYNFLYDTLDTNFEKVCLNNDALTEGFAVYAAEYASKYLKDVDKGLITLTQDNELLTYYIILQCDINIHTKNWTAKDLVQFFGSDEQTLEPLYKQLQANPAAFIPYYFGYLQITNLKDEVEDELDDENIEFSHQEFIQTLLESGNVPFNVIEKHFDEYIEAKTK